MPPKTTKTIPPTAMVERYSAVGAASQEERLALALEDLRDPRAVAAAFVASVREFSSYDNDEAFLPASRPAPVGGPALWETNDVAHYLHPEGELVATVPTSTPEGPTEVRLQYVARELQPARTTGVESHAKQQRSAKESGVPLQLVTLDLLMRSQEGLPVAVEVKTPSDVDEYYALIQVLAAASQLATSNQAKRIRSQYAEAGFADVADPRVEAFVMVVDPNRCGAPEKAAKYETKGTPAFKPKLNESARELAEALATDPQLAPFLRRLGLIVIGVEDEVLTAEVRWVYEVGEPAQEA